MLSYLTAFFNSKIFRFTFKEYFPELLGDTRELSKTFFETVSVEIVDESTDKLFERLLESVVELKKQKKSTLEMEKQIELKLAQVYSLSEDEIRLIELSESAGDVMLPAITDRSEAVNS